MKVFYVVLLFVFSIIGCKTASIQKNESNLRKLATNRACDLSRITSEITGISEKATIDLTRINTTNRYNYRVLGYRPDQKVEFILMNGNMDYEHFLFGLIKKIYYKQFWNYKYGDPRKYNSTFISSYLEKGPGSGTDLDVLDCEGSLIGMVARHVTSSGELGLAFHLGDFKQPVVAKTRGKKDGEISVYSVNNDSTIFKIRPKEREQSTGIESKKISWEIERVSNTESELTSNEKAKIYIMLINQLLWEIWQEF